MVDLLKLFKIKEIRDLEYLSLDLLKDKKSKLSKPKYVQEFKSLIDGENDFDFFI